MLKRLWLGLAQIVAVGLVVWLLFAVTGNGPAPEACEVVTVKEAAAPVAADVAAAHRREAEGPRF